MKKIILIRLLSVLLLLASCTNSNTPENEMSKNDNLENQTIENNDQIQCEHEWRDATCQLPKMCIKCSETDGKKLDHEYQSFTVIPATCTENGIMKYECTKCMDVYNEEISETGHNYILQKSGEDKCSYCNKKTYTTNSTKALACIYSLLRNPRSAQISSIYAGTIKWDNVDSIAVVIKLSAQNGFGGMSTAEYVVLIDSHTGSIVTHDLVGDMESKANYYLEKSQNAFGADKLEPLKQYQEYTEKVILALEIIQQKTSLLSLQDKAYIDNLARKVVGF